MEAFASDRGTSNSQMAGTWTCRSADSPLYARCAVRGRACDGRVEKKFEKDWNETPASRLMARRRVACPPAPNPSPIRRTDPGPSGAGVFFYLETSEKSGVFGNGRPYA